MTPMQNSPQDNLVQATQEMDLEALQEINPRVIRANTDSKGFVQVPPKQRHNPTPTPKEYLCGILLSRMGPYHELKKYPIPFHSIFEALAIIDPQVAIVPAKSDPAKLLDSLSSSGQLKITRL